VSEEGRLIEILWDLFKDEITSGEPVFFCFSQETLRERLGASGSEVASPLALVCATARRCFDVEGHHVYLHPESLIPAQKGVSMAIVLVCQQVLAVEDMVRESSGVSENAYFPRLRALMSSELTQISVNPFPFADFESIWKQFASEVRAFSGSSDDTVTFEFDTYTGVNKARQFPLSQALLSREDLLEITRRAKLERLRKGSPGEVWSEIRRERHRLGRRAQRLISSGFLREQIIQQVRRFSSRSLPSGLPVNKPTLTSSGLLLGIYLDPTDWMSEEYRAFVKLKGASDIIEDDERVKEKLNSALAGRGYAFCSLSESEDYWTIQDSEIVPGDTVLVLGVGFGMQRARAILDGLTPPVTLEDSRIRPLGSSRDVQVCPVVLPSSMARSLKLRCGKIAEEDCVAGARVDYEWIGGICVDHRSRKYLLQALPSAVRFDARDFNLQDITRVNDLPMSWEGLEKLLGKVETDSTYDLRFQNGKVARLSVGVVRSSVAERVGLLVDSKGWLSPTLERIGDSDVAVVGFAAPTLIRPAGIGETAGLLRDLAGGARQCWPDSRSQDVWRRIEASSGVPHPVKRLIKELLARKTVE
jgi:hypothetical protein